MFNIQKESFEWGGRTLTLETGKIARQADGSVLATYGETVVLATVVGAVGGGLAGNEIEKRQRATTVYELKIRMADGTLRSVTQSQALTVGQQVRVEGETVKPA